MFLHIRDADVSFEPCLCGSRMASSSASGCKLAELEEKLQGLEEQKAAVLVLSEIGPRDLILLGELNKDLDRVQAAITALSYGEPHFPVSASAPHSSLV